MASLGDYLQDFVADGMSVRVVTMLEIIDVHHHDRQWMSVSAGSSEFAVSHLEDSPAVCQVCQCIRGRQMLHFFEETHLFHRDAELIGESDQKAFIFGSKCMFPGAFGINDPNYLAANLDGHGELRLRVRAEAEIDRILDDIAVSSWLATDRNVADDTFAKPDLNSFNIPLERVMVVGGMLAEETLFDKKDAKVMWGYALADDVGHACDERIDVLGIRAGRSERMQCGQLFELTLELVTIVLAPVALPASGAPGHSSNEGEQKAKARKHHGPS